MYKHLKSVTFIKRYYLRKQFLKVIRNEVSCNNFLREKAVIKLSSFPKKSSNSKNIRYCLLTRRKRGVKQKFSLSRMTIRELFKKGQIPGFFI